MLYQANIELISVNTDGVVIHYSEQQRQTVLKIWKDWEKLTTYTLEDTYYNKIVFTSVNDYIAEICDQKGNVLYYKFKGDFEIDKEPHKNNSQRIIPIALKEYFINKVPLNKVINNIGYEFINSKGNKELTSIYDYCIGKKKAKTQLYHYVTKGNHAIIKDKVIRYYIVDSNIYQNKLFKEYKSGKRADKSNEKALESLNKGFNHMLFMDYENKDNYNISKFYYHQECIKIIEPIERNTRLRNGGKVEQLSLF